MLLYSITSYSYSYGKTKELFGWPEESDEAVGSSTIIPTSTIPPSEIEQALANLMPISKLERYVIVVFDINL